MSMIGFESPAKEYEQQALSLDNILIPHPSATYLARACGEAMEGAGIFDQDLLIIDRAETPVNGSVIVCTYNGVFYCRILDKVNGQLLAARDDYAPVALHQGEDFCIEGVVISSVRLHVIPPDLRE